MQRRAKCFSKITVVLFIVFFIWIFLQFLAPIALPENSVPDLSGLVAITDNNKVIDNMGIPWNFIYSAGDKLCHQRAERSFIINGNQMPFCARCTAIWLGVAIGLGFMVFYKIQLDDKLIFVIIVCIIPLGIDGVGQLFGFWESVNIVRLITGLMAGLVCGFVIGLLASEVSNILRKKQFKNKKKEKEELL